MNEYSTSQTSLTLPPPPAELRQVYLPPQQTIYANNNNNNNINNNIQISTPSIDECDRATTPVPIIPLSPQPIYSSVKSALKAPPYKSPPPYANGVNANGSQTVSSPSVQQKSVTFADSPVLLRRKVCFEDEVMTVQQPQQISLPTSPRRSANAPPPPPRTETTRLSTIASPKRLSESSSNPPTDFLYDLQRVMRKKWQIAQKCKLEPATTPQEVLGFRDFDQTKQGEYRDTSHFYRESSNVSNWVQEHYGGIAVDSLYENLGVDVNACCPLPTAIKKRPPPPPPKRNTTTVLTHRT